ncbi:hypothetical protein EVAR_31985_1 [Eumeta japonica]|uniref:Serine/threonine specific protein phosphatases domain-containing protein n=1 Tax=Eumeta variegata TaxID=151549 RepID=A0A4C1VTM4_EUMVA|nr:hypothetical protein EVAR_31985_1 [Eumeta japonica]
MLSTGRCESVHLCTLITCLLPAEVDVLRMLLFSTPHLYLFIDYDNDIGCATQCELMPSAKFSLSFEFTQSNIIQHNINVPWKNGKRVLQNVTSLASTAGRQCKVFDILWSDPQCSGGCVANALRGAGTYFGPDVTSAFLQRNKLTLLVRSHECKPGGYEILHNGNVITIFSASNYYELGSNKGAYLKLCGNSLERQFVQYTAAVSRTRRLTFRQRVGLVESSAMRELHHQILSVRRPLEATFRSMDIDQSEQLKSVSTALLRGRGRRPDRARAYGLAEHLF